MEDLRSDLKGESSSTLKNMKCNYCQNLFDLQNRIPIKLDCGHSICTECCRKYIQNENEVECKVDKSRFQLSSNILSQQDYSIIIMLYQEKEKEQKLKEQTLNQIKQNMQTFKSKKKNFLKNFKEAQEAKDQISQALLKMQIGLEQISNHFIKELLSLKKQFYWNKIKDIKTNLKIIDSTIQNTQLVLKYETEQQTLSVQSDMTKLQNISSSLQNLIDLKQTNLKEEETASLLKDKTPQLIIEEFISLIQGQK